MAGRPSKPIELVKGHRTKAEIKQRREAEKALYTGIEMKPWDTLDEAARKEFIRIKKLFGDIKIDDALYESVINRYCELHSECIEFKAYHSKFITDIDKVIEEFELDNIDFVTYITMKDKISSRIISNDKQLQNKRNMMLAIEKENLMTAQAASRSVPKKVIKDGSPKSPMAELMAKRELKRLQEAEQNKQE